MLKYNIKITGVIAISPVKRTQLSRCLPSHHLKTEEKPASETSWFYIIFQYFIRTMDKVQKTIVSQRTKRSSYESVSNSFPYSYENPQHIICNKLHFSLTSPTEIKRQTERSYQNDGMMGSSLIFLPTNQLRRWCVKVPICIKSRLSDAHKHYRSSVFQRISAQLYHPSLHHTTTISDCLSLGWWSW
jgi:hypothetical protein